MMIARLRLRLAEHLLASSIAFPVVRSEPLKPPGDSSACMFLKDALVRVMNG
jgi:hypothetical protein